MYPLWHSCPMSNDHEDEVIDLRLVGRSEDGNHLEFSDIHNRHYQARLSDTLRAAVNQPRLAAIKVESEEPTTSVKDVQSRLRAGESMDAISRTTDWSLEKIEKFAGPILQERAFVIAQALKSPIRRDASSPTLQEAMISQLATHGVDVDEVEWNTHRRRDGLWDIALYYPNRDGQADAHWSFNSSTRTLTAEDDSAKWIAGEAKESRPRTPSQGLVYPTQNTGPAPRLVSVKEETVSIEVSETFEFEDENQDAGFESDAVEDDAEADGVVKRVKLPSWDDIMFGSKKDRNDD
jgi:Protein of unknown function (DUF3071)